MEMNLSHTVEIILKLISSFQIILHSSYENYTIFFFWNFFEKMENVAREFWQPSTVREYSDIFLVSKKMFKYHLISSFTKLIILQQRNNESLQHCCETSYTAFLYQYRNNWKYNFSSFKNGKVLHGLLTEMCNTVIWNMAFLESSVLP